MFQKLTKYILKENYISPRFVKKQSSYSWHKMFRLKKQLQFKENVIQLYKLKIWQ